jgi:hypothetical protein
MAEGQLCPPSQTPLHDPRMRCYQRRHSHIGNDLVVCTRRRGSFEPRKSSVDASDGPFTGNQVSCSQHTFTQHYCLDSSLGFVVRTPNGLNDIPYELTVGETGCGKLFRIVGVVTVHQDHCRFFQRAAGPEPIWQCVDGAHRMTSDAPNNREVACVFLQAVPDNVPRSVAQIDTFTVEYEGLYDTERPVRREVGECPAAQRPPFSVATWNYHSLNSSRLKRVAELTAHHDLVLPSEIWTPDARASAFLEGFDAAVSCPRQGHGGGAVILARQVSSVVKSATSTAHHCEVAGAVVALPSGLRVSVAAIYATNSIAAADPQAALTQVAGQLGVPHLDVIGGDAARRRCQCAFRGSVRVPGFVGPRNAH